MSSLESGKTLTALLNDVLDLSKIEAGKMEIAAVDGDLAVTFDRLRQLFLSKAPTSAGSTSTLDVAPGMPRCCTTIRCACASAWATCLSNAIKFTERGNVKIRSVSSEEVTRAAAGASASR
jgi:signal transduction histidine kinase